MDQRKVGVLYKKRNHKNKRQPKKARTKDDANGIRVCPWWDSVL